MSMQIKNIVLYSNTGERRELSFRTNALNIITGPSKSGKSALIKIVEYCLGAKECSIFAGVILESVEWFGLHLELHDQEYFIARKRPDVGKKSSEEILLLQGRALEIPDKDELEKNISSTALDRLLSEALGIDGYSYSPDIGHTRSTGSADIGKALIYCFLDQDDVDSSKFLFHRQGEPFLPQSIKDYLPYFLGAVDSELPKQQQELRRHKHTLKELTQRKNSADRIRGESFVRAHGLIQESQQVGLLGNDVVLDENWDNVLYLLNSAVNEPLNFDELPEISGGEQLESIFEKQRALRSMQNAINDEMAALRHLKGSSDGFFKEATEQRARLESIGILPLSNDSDESTACPLCGTSHEAQGNASAIQAHLEDISTRLEGVANDTPEIEVILADALERKEAITDKLAECSREIEDLQKNHARLGEFRDLQARKAMVKGRISLYLDSFVPPSDDPNSLDPKISEIESKISELEEAIGNDNLKENLNSFLHLLSSRLSTIAKELGLEHSEYPLRLDPTKLTVIADTPDGPRPMSSMGSGETWVSLHVTVYLILQQWFRAKSRPVPAFLFIDQPSQAYFLPEASTEEIRRGEKDALQRIYKLIVNVLAESGQFQVIVTDHADIAEDWFQENVTEKWWNGTRLVPSGWIDK